MRLENAVVIIWDEIGEDATTFFEAADRTQLVLDRDLTPQELDAEISLKLWRKEDKVSGWPVTGSAEINNVTIITTKTDRGHRGTVQIVWLGAAE